MNPSWQVITEVSGCLIMHMPEANQSGDSLLYGDGARWTPLAAHRFSPFAQFMFGGRRVTHETANLLLREQLMKDWDDGNGPLGHYPKRSDWSVEVSKNGPSIVAGGGNICCLEHSCSTFRFFARENYFLVQYQC